MTRIAVVTVVHGRHAHLALQQESIGRSTRRPDEHVVIAMDDPELLRRGIARADTGTTPLGLPLARARNLGARHALDGGADVLVFLDVDCAAGPSLVDAYAEAVADEPDTVWSGPVTYLPPPPPTGYDLDLLVDLDDPHPARPAPPAGVRLQGADPDLFWSLSFACSAAAWERTGGFCEEYVGYGGEDTDFGRLIGSAALDLGWAGSARAFHQWHPVSRPPVEHVVDIVRNAELFRSRWGEVAMLGWLRAFGERGLAMVDADGRWHATRLTDAPVVSAGRAPRPPAP